MLVSSLITVAAGLVGSVCAAPLAKRALSSNDISVLQLANYLEHLEYALYSSGYNNFTDKQYQADGFSAYFRKQVNVIAQHEKTHFQTISKILSDNGVTPVPPCTYKFPFSTPKQFVSLANMITSVGIGAYIGGGELLTDNPNLLTSASTILTTEARHDSYLRAGLGASPFPTPFDTPLTGVWAYNLAQMFIVSCPQDLPIIKLPKLALVAPQPPINLRPPTPAGTALNFKWDPSTFFVNVDPNAPLYVAFINQAAPPVFEKVTPTGSGTGTVAVPKGVSGVAFAVLTTFAGGLNATQLTQFGTLAGPAEVTLA